MLGAEEIKFSSFSDEEIANLFAPLRSQRSLAVGVSGGSDSMALMLMLARWRKIVGEDAPDLSVLSVDHKLRPESADEVALVARVCQQYGLTHKAFSWSGDKSKGNISAKSRDARYDLMCDWCAVQQIGHLLVAHTLDDQAETVLLRLARGSGVDGLSAMATSRLWNATIIYRPLLNVERYRLVQLLESISCPYATDPSNHDLKYDRVKFRQALKILEPLGITSQGLAGTASRLAQARQALEVMTDEAIAQAVVIHDAGYCVLSVQQLGQFPYEIKRRVLGRVLRAVAGRDYAPPHFSLDQLIEWMMADDKLTRTLGGCLLMPRYRDVWVMRETGRNCLEQVLLQPGDCILWDNRFHVSLDASAENPLTVRALGVEDFARIKPDLATKMQLPSALCAGLPSFWQDQALFAVPHLNFRRAKTVYQIEADFANSAQLKRV